VTSLASAHPARTLADLAIGARARVVAVSGETGLRRRLLEMGVLPGTAIEVVRIAPLGDPIEVRLRGYSLSIRRDDARIVAVEVSAP
jgi:ferrous iron transport protein A